MDFFFSKTVLFKYIPENIRTKMTIVMNHEPICAGFSNSGGKIKFG